MDINDPYDPYEIYHVYKPKAQSAQPAAGEPAAGVAATILTILSVSAVATCVIAILAFPRFCCAQAPGGPGGPPGTTFSWAESSQDPNGESAADQKTLTAAAAPQPADIKQAVAVLDNCKRPSVPHYWVVTSAALSTANRPLVDAFARAAGGIAFTHTSNEAGLLCMQVKAATGCKVAVIVAMHMDSSFSSLDGALQQGDILDQRAAQGVAPDLVLVHYETPRGHVRFDIGPTWTLADVQDMVHVWRAMVRRAFPHAKVGFYHWPSWAASPDGSGYSGLWTDVTPPSDYRTCNLYLEDAVGNQHVMSHNLEHPGTAGQQLLPFFGCLFYLSQQRADGTVVWTSQPCSVRRPAVEWWQMGKRINWAASHDQLVGVWWWLPPMDSRVNLAWFLEDWVSYTKGLSSAPL